MTMMSGVVAETATKDVTTKFGVKPTYSFKLKDNAKWIKCGFVNPNIEAGYTIDFDATEGSYGIETKKVNILSRDTKVMTTTVTPAASKPAYSGGYSSSKVFPIPALHGDRAIVRQNALARATDLYIAARGSKPFDLDVSNLDLIISFARRFEAYTAGDLDMAEALEENTTVGAANNSF